MTRGRPVQYDPDTVLDAALQLFWSRGYEGTSLHDLLRVTGLSRSSFYQAFGSKRELYLRCLQVYNDRALAGLQAVYAESGGGLAFFKTHLLSVAETVRQVDERRGCMVLNAANEFEQSVPDVATIVTRSTNRVRAVYEKALAQAVADGDLHSGTNTSEMADYLFLCQSGLRTMVKAGLSRRRLEKAVGMVLTSVV